jgi:hypothetical protein
MFFKLFYNKHLKIKIMKNKNFELYIKYISDLIKDNTKKAKLEADNPEKGEADYNTGYLMAYHEVISTMKNQALLFDLEQDDISLSDIEPDRDLV